MEAFCWPICYREQLELGDQDSCVAVCTAWSPRKKIAQALPPRSFSVVGNLYSRDGINAIIRNALANPAIRHIILSGETLTDSADALLAFFYDGIDGQWRIVGSGGQIDPEIPLSAIERLRSSVSLHDLRRTTSPSLIADTIKHLPRLPPWGDPDVFPETRRSAETLPSEGSGFVIRGESIEEVWVHLLFHIMSFGRITSTDYGQHQKELIDVMAVLKKGGTSTKRLPNWMPMTTEEAKRYADDFLRSEPPAGVAYSYGHRLRSYWDLDQIDAMTTDLKRSRLSRRALACLWDVTRDSSSEDPPCLDIVQAVIRDEELYLTAYIRSNDIFRAWPQNIFGLRRLQEELAGRFDAVTAGDLITISQSAHIYEDSWVKANSVLQTEGRQADLKGDFRQDDRGSFVIRVERGEIVVDHYSPQGDKLRTLSGGSARELGKQLALYISFPEHAVYVGRQLALAELSMRRGEPFEQDMV